jgi:signal peptide peptidase SppA
MKIWNRLKGEPWAITGSSLQTILDIANRNNEAPEIVAARLGKELQNTYNVDVRDDVAIIPIVGPLFRYANLFTSVSGATSYEMIARDFVSVVNDPLIKAIVLNIDSPGGEVNGCAELADLIYEARGKKPIIAYASGDAASGAYWIAAACDKIITSKTSAIGSIGVVGLYHNNAESEEIEIVSSQSPHKRLNPRDDEDKKRLQARIDAMAQVFVESIAKYRGVSVETVLKTYGAGDIFIGEEAAKLGLTEGIASLDKILFELTYKKSNLTTNQEKTKMDIETLRDEHPSIISQLIAEEKLEERKRIESIITSEAAIKCMELAQHLAFTTDMSQEIALSVLSKVQTNVRDDTGFIAAMQSIENPKIIPSMDNETDDINALIKRMASY